MEKMGENGFFGKLFIQSCEIIGKEPWRKFITDEALLF